MSALKQLFPLKFPRLARDENTLTFDRSRLSEQQEILLRSVINEFYCSAKLTVVFTSIVNARHQAIELQSMSQPSAYIPTDPLLFPAVAAGLTPSFGHSHLINALQDYYSRLIFARAFSVLPAAAASGITTKNLELDQIADVWQRICDLANVVAHQLYDVENIEYSPNNHQLLSIHSLIKAAQSGLCPCVRMDGSIFVPGWLDQRREARRPLGWKVWFESGNSRERATLQDISSGGMGLVACQARPLGTQISVQLTDARCLIGVVTWSKPDRMGIRFLQPLSHTDPLLTAVSKQEFSSLN